MCGITGALIPQRADEAPAAEAVTRGLHKLARRGPDHQAQTNLPGVCLGHARLSILDLSDAAHQPMPSPDGNHWLAFNGEVFNYHALKADLERQGERFTTSSDTEVLLRLLQREGPACLARLNGFWALAYWDAPRQRLLLARDRYGVKPLYYQWHEGRLLWASEPKALLAAGVPAQLNPEVLTLYMNLGYVPPQHCMLQGMQQLAPGHYWWVQTGGEPSTPQPYYTLPPVAARGSAAQQHPTYEARQRHLATLMADAVRLRLVADVPVGVFLSGGIDSSVVAALAAQAHPGLHTFSIGFTDALYDETHYARMVAAHIGSQHEVFTLTNEDLYEAMEGVLDYVDEPFADASALNVYVLSRLVRQRVTVALSGDGADEVFGGYQKHLAEWRVRQGGAKVSAVRLLAPLLRHLPAARNAGPLGRRLWQLRKLAQGLAQPAPQRYWQWACAAEPGLVNQLLKTNPPEAAWQARIAHYTQEVSQAGTPDRLTDMLRADMALVLPGDMLTKVDRMSMAHGLEVRTPFLDYRVVDYAFTLPTTDLLHQGQRKRIVQDAFRHLLPAALYHRPKQGFEVPLGQWFRGPMQARVEAELNDTAFLHHQNLFHPQALKELWLTVKSGRGGKHDLTLWAWLVFQHWYRRYLT